jgi:hypothetical protein
MTAAKVWINDKAPRKTGEMAVYVILVRSLKWGFYQFR